MQNLQNISLSKIIASKFNWSFLPKLISAPYIVNTLLMNGSYFIAVKPIMVERIQFRYLCLVSYTLDVYLTLAYLHSSSTFSTYNIP